MATSLMVVWVALCAPGGGMGVYDGLAAFVCVCGVCGACVHTRASFPSWNWR